MGGWVGFPRPNFKNNLEQTKQASKNPVSKANSHFTNKAKRNLGILWFLAAYLVQTTTGVHNISHHKAIPLRMVKLAAQLIPGPSLRGHMAPLIVL